MGQSRGQWLLKKCVLSWWKHEREYPQEGDIRRSLFPSLGLLGQEQSQGVDVLEEAQSKNIPEKEKNGDKGL